MIKRTIFFICLLCSLLNVTGQPHKKNNILRQTDPEFFKSDEARRVGDQLLLFQRVTGGWPKNVDMVSPLDENGIARVRAEYARRDDSTTDNNATSMQMLYLARLYNATCDGKYRDSFRKGVEYLLSGQYENGGWPQFWPQMRGYQIHITYNDNAMVNTLTLFDKIIKAEYPFDGDLTDKLIRKKLKKSFDKGIDCIIATLIIVDGKPTVWCQQHDRETFAPAHARAYELPSFCSSESASIVSLLMSLPDPDEKIKRSVHGAMRWFDRYKLTGLRLKRTGYNGQPGSADTRLVEEAGAGPIWARFYDLEYCEPYVCDRDGVPRRHLEQIGYERRNGYSWFNNNAVALYPLYDKWASENDPENKVEISLETKGANENGTIEMFRKPLVDRKSFDMTVNPGESIQDAISNAPANPEKPFKILIRNGVYNQKVIIDRPNIVLVGENRDSTVIVLAERSGMEKIKQYNGKPVGNGVIVIQEGADDCVISGMTVYNNYGTTVENTTTHQMAIFGRATRTIVINSNVWADGNDALSLWARNAGGMYYHADLYVRCPGVDFLCPRGWCYATRCKFYGDGRALIWHDGRGDRSKKLVITESEFDSKRPAPLGRYHHDAKFFLLNCKFSERIIDSNIGYAYTDKVLDPCPWGQRVYFHNCSREGGHSGWIADNFKASEEAPEFYGVTAKWTFDDKWDPEKRIHDLWDVLAY